MGRNRVFSYCQSREDVPCRITGEAGGEPVLSLSKWDREAGMLFRSEFDTERVRHIGGGPGVTVMTTNRRRHVYRRLDAGRFEYDIILPEYPGTSAFKIPLEDTGGLSFYKQGLLYPELMSPDILGSYAVYWKRRDNGYKTGKFCHIYRPKIIDAKGQWIWGELDWDGEALWVTADDKWLKNARYPVTVDPVIGTQSAGAGTYDFANNDPDSKPIFESCIAVNRFVLSAGMAGGLTAYFHSWTSDGDAGGYGVMYDDTGGSVPRYLVSSGAPFFDLNSGWTGTGFNLTRRIAEGNNVWMGICAQWLYFPSFDEITGHLAKAHFLDNPLSGPVSSFRTDGIYSNILMSMYCSYVPSYYYSNKIVGRIKPDEELQPCGHYDRVFPEDQSLQEIVEAKRGILRLLEPVCSLADQLERNCFFSPLLMSAVEVKDLFSRALSYFRSMTASLSVWDYFRFFHRTVL